MSRQNDNVGIKLLTFFQLNSRWPISQLQEPTEFEQWATHQLPDVRLCTWDSVGFTTTWFRHFTTVRCTAKGVTVRRGGLEAPAHSLRWLSAAVRCVSPLPLVMQPEAWSQWGNKSGLPQLSFESRYITSLLRIWSDFLHPSQNTDTPLHLARAGLKKKKKRITWPTVWWLGGGKSLTAQGLFVFHWVLM